MSPFSAPFSGAPKSEGFCFQIERLLYGREPNVLRRESSFGHFGSIGWPAFCGNNVVLRVLHDASGIRRRVGRDLAKGQNP